MKQYYCPVCYRVHSCEYEGNLVKCEDCPARAIDECVDSAVAVPRFCDQHGRKP